MTNTQTGTGGNMTQYELRSHLMKAAFRDDRGFWRCWAPASDMSQHLGSGTTIFQAVDDVIVKLEAREAFLALSSEDKLREIMKKKDILDTDQQLCIRLLTEIVLEKREWI